MSAPAIAMAATVVVVFSALAAALWKGNVGIVSGFPEGADKLEEADRKSMGRGLAVLVLFLMLVTVMMVFAFSQVEG